MIDVAVLSVSTYKALVAWAEHWYGHFTGSLAEKEPSSRLRNWDVYKDTEVCYTITEAAARKLNKAARSQGFDGFTYRVGEQTGRFFSEAHLEQRAIEMCQGLGYDALIRGNTAGCHPQRVLYGPEMEALNEICARYDALYDEYYDPPLKLVEPLEKAWADIAFPLGLTDKYGCPAIRQN